MITIDRLDHVVLTARDVDATCDFYRRVLGMRVEIFGNGRKALVYGDQKINLHQAGAEFEPKADRPTPGALDLCFTTRDPIDQVIAHLRAEGVTLLDGPVVRTGARATLMSVYFRDPDLNLIEVSNEIG